MATIERDFVRTHGFIDFKIDLHRPLPELWMLLGEARSKINHISRSLLKPGTAEHLHYVYLAKGAHATTAIEGNTLSEEQVLGRVEGQLELPQSQEYLGKEVDNIIHAYNMIWDELLEQQALPLDLSEVERYNALVLDGLELEDGVVPGEIRMHPVVVNRYRAAPAQDCAFLVETLCDWLNGPAFAPPTENHAIPLAILKAVIAHLYVAWIHPFGDGNGRTARMIELRILTEAGVPTPAGHLLSNHYNKTRQEYYRQLDRSSKAEDGVHGFVLYAVRGFVDGLHEQLDHIWEMQYADRWEQYIYENFGDATTKARLRQRELALAIAKADAPVPRNEIRHLTPELAEQYAGKTQKIITRDINALRKMQLVVQRRNGFAANSSLILAFKPVTAEIAERLPAGS